MTERKRGCTSTRPPQWGGWAKESMRIDTMKRILANQEEREKRDGEKEKEHDTAQR